MLPSRISSSGCDKSQSSAAFASASCGSSPAAPRNSASPATKIRPSAPRRACMAGRMTANRANLLRASVMSDASAWTASTCRPALPTSSTKRTPRNSTVGCSPCRTRTISSILTVNPSAADAIFSSCGRKSPIRGRIQTCSASTAAVTATMKTPAVHAAARVRVRSMEGRKTRRARRAIRFWIDVSCMENKQ